MRESGVPASRTGAGGRAAGAGAAKLAHFVQAALLGPPARAAVPRASPLGQALIDATERLFALWYRVRDGTMSWAAFQEAVVLVRADVGTLLRAEQALTHARTGGTRGHLVALDPALWTFAIVAGVEPTNNPAEQASRRAVLRRTRSLGTKIDAGSRVVERLLTVVTTCRQQQRDVLDYLTLACQAATLGSAPPSLVPAASPAPPSLLPASARPAA